MPADSASAAQCNAREFGTSGGQPSDWIDVHA
jgi:hypothetical protein